MIIRLYQEGVREVEVDDEEYAEAKASGRLDHLLDHDISDMETDCWLVEPDGTAVYPWG